MKPLQQVLRDLEFAAGQGTLTPSFLDCYARRHGEKVLALYALAAHHGLPVADEDGRNDHLAPPREWRSSVDLGAVERELDARSAAVVREVHDAADDGRPAVLRKRDRRGSHPLTTTGG
ncbi:hypothetical protein [Kineococcus radiotolerans]|uniref:Uncharacterized protein n=1 Tax=Kineococcus radiotolerans (strain ATCC BAA-149 / DSM 14245 / SRS30216) TaxID=266940 RepID=A6WEH6_KINRD|nr:hypothetical protein [Kineococcus radiotolerans]ABS05215.1 hypothetical protein Krad_3752 [Kineococcus radiotolerans SRS30216 = ATCC BAA-149]